MALLEDYSKLLSPQAISGGTTAPLIGAAGTDVGRDFGKTADRSFGTPMPGYHALGATAVHAFDPNVAPVGAPSDWQKIIDANPDYMAWKLSAAERADVGQSQRKAALRALAIRFGGLPQGFADAYGDIDPDTARIAAENPTSESNRLLRDYGQSVEQSHRQLAARGMLQSGELGYEGDNLDFQRAAGVSDMNNQFLDAAQGTINDYAGLVAGLNSEQIDQIRAAAAASYASGSYGGGGDYGGGDNTDPTNPTAPAPGGGPALVPGQPLTAAQLAALQQALDEQAKKMAQAPDVRGGTRYGI